MIREGSLQPGVDLIGRLAEPLEPENRRAVALWNRFSGHTDAATLELMVELYGVEDLDALLGRFEVLRVYTG